MSVFIKTKKMSMLKEGLKDSFSLDIDANFIGYATDMLEKPLLLKPIQDLLVLSYFSSTSCPEHHQRGHQNSLKPTIQLNYALGLINGQALKRFCNQDHLFEVLNKYYKKCWKHGKAKNKAKARLKKAREDVKGFSGLFDYKYGNSTPQGCKEL